MSLDFLKKYYWTCFQPSGHMRNVRSMADLDQVMAALVAERLKGRVFPGTYETWATALRQRRAKLKQRGVRA